MPISYRKPARTMSATFDAASRQAGKALKAVALDVYKQVTTKAPVGTPVDTGFHISAWNFTVNRLSRRIIAPYRRTDRKRGRQTIFPSPPEDRGKTVKAGDRIYVSNRADVIDLLNRGLSKQQPVPGFFQRAVARAVARSSATIKNALTLKGAPTDPF